MNKRQKKKLEKKFDSAEEFGMPYSSTYREIREMNRGYHDCCIYIYQHQRYTDEDLDEIESIMGKINRKKYEYNKYQRLRIKTIHRQQMQTIEIVRGGKE